MHYSNLMTSAKRFMQMHGLSVFAVVSFIFPFFSFPPFEFFSEFHGVPGKLSGSEIVFYVRVFSYLI